MTPEEQRIAIAEACPFVRKDGHWVYKAHGVARWIFFDPLEDLNAMHEADKTIETPAAYEHWLIAVVKDGYHSRATAAQRADAFLRTIGKWKE